MTTPPTNNFAMIPEPLRRHRQWVVYTTKPKASGKFDKVPHNPNTGRRASTTDPKTWGTFTQAVDRYNAGSFAGIGFVFTKDDPYFGLDLDDVIDENGIISADALAILDQLGTYTEITPSGRGVHAIGEGELPTGGRRRGNVETYDDERFFTVTGAVLNGRAEIRNCNGALTALHRQIFGDAKPKETTLRVQPTLSLEDTEVLKRARKVAQFCALYDNGDLSATKDGDGSQSSADLALCNHLRFWTGGDLHQMDRLFRQSALMRPKWDERRGELTYGEKTLTLALTGPVYTPPTFVTATPDPIAADSGRGTEDARDEIIAVQAARIAELEATVATQHRVITGAVAVLEADMKPEAKVVQMGIAFRQHHGFGVRRPQADDETAELTAFYVHQPTEAERLHISTDAIQDVMNVATEHGAAFVKRDKTLTASPFTGEVLDQPHKFVAYVPAHDDLGETLHSIAAANIEALKKKRRQSRNRSEPATIAIPPPTPPICDCGGDTDRRTERADVARCTSCNTATQAVLIADGAVLRPIAADSGRGVSPSLTNTVANGSTTDARSGRGTKRCAECQAPLKPDGTCGWAAAHAEDARVEGEPATRVMVLELAESIGYPVVDVPGFGTIGGTLAWSEVIHSPEIGSPEVQSLYDSLLAAAGGDL
jgi:putative DNA primase/helicase